MTWLAIRQRREQYRDHGILVLSHGLPPQGGEGLSIARAQGVSPRLGDPSVPGAQTLLDDLAADGRLKVPWHNELKVPGARWMAEKMMRQTHGWI